MRSRFCLSCLGNLISFRISAGGFNYVPGFAYARDSLSTDGAALLANIGWAGLLLAAAGAVHDWRDPDAGPIVRLSLAIILATLIFQAIVPVTRLAMVVDQRLHGARVRLDRAVSAQDDRDARPPRRSRHCPRRRTDAARLPAQQHPWGRRSAIGIPYVSVFFCRWSWCRPRRRSQWTSSRPRRPACRRQRLAQLFGDDS